MTVGGAIYNTLAHYSTSKHGDAEPKVNGFKFDPRRGKNRSLRGPVQTPLIVRAQVDGVVTKLRVPKGCLLYTSPSPRDGLLSRMPSSA